MNRLFVALMAAAFLMTGTAIADTVHPHHDTGAQGQASERTFHPTPTPKPTPKTHGKTYNASHSNTAHHMATPKPSPTPNRSHMAVKGSGVPTCANGIRYVSSTGAVICNSEQIHAHFVTPKPTHKPY